MPRRIVDLSVPLETGIASDPPMALPEIDYLDHQATAQQVMAFFPGLTKDQLPNGEGWGIEQLRITTHNGTHLDAPWHFASTMNKGERAMTIDEMPLEWCFNPGVKLDFRHFENGYVATAADVEAELKRIDHELQPLDIVVVNTAAGARYGQPDYVGTGCGMGREIIWEGHRAGMEIGYGHIEKLANLDQLPPTGYQIACFPYKIKGASAGFTRAVAIFED